MMKRTIEMVLMTLLIILAAASVGMVLMGCETDDEPGISDVNLIYGTWQNTEHQWGFTFYNDGRMVDDGKIIMWSYNEGDYSDMLWGTFWFSDGKIVINKNRDMTDLSPDIQRYEVIQLNKKRLVIREYTESFGQSNYRDMIFSRPESYVLYKN